MSMPCWVCGAAAPPSRSLAPLGFLECPECGLAFRPGIDAAATRAVYEGGQYEGRDFAADYAVPATIAARRGQARRRLAWVRSYAGAGRLLDVGAAGGAFVLEAREAGFDAMGVEPAPAFARHARDVLGVDVRDGRIEELELPQDEVDAVTMWHVLEHIPAPLDTLEHIRGLLRPGTGLLFAEVPNFTSVAARSMGRDWTHLDPSVHVSQFTPDALRRLVTGAELDVVDLHSVAHGASLSVRQRWAPTHVVHRAKLARHGLMGLRRPAGHEFLRVIARRPR
jgi:2-polyprenyl-3-methyl-5-hydroxy-6-metoxy-1,4-benzoquinol methylase